MSTLPNNAIWSCVWLSCILATWIIHRTYIHSRKYIHTYTCIYICIYTHTRIYSYIYIYIQQGDCAVHTSELPHTHTTQTNLHMAFKDNVYSIYLYIYIYVEIYIYTFIYPAQDCVNRTWNPTHLKPHELLFFTKLRIPWTSLYCDCIGTDNLIYRLVNLPILYTHV